MGIMIDGVRQIEAPATYGRGYHCKMALRTPLGEEPKRPQST